MRRLTMENIVYLNGKETLFSLNHCQFLCYRMLKIYLNEILNKYEGMKDLVSSYTMITSLFWEVQSSYKNPWYFDTLLQSFGRCVKRIYKWVQTENCPNFFIPQNNMFENRIYGCEKTTVTNFTGNTAW